MYALAIDLLSRGVEKNYWEGSFMIHIMNNARTKCITCHLLSPILHFPAMYGISRNIFTAQLEICDTVMEVLQIQHKAQAEELFEKEVIHAPYTLWSKRGT